mgnify:FL=1
MVYGCPLSRGMGEGKPNCSSQLLNYCTFCTCQLNEQGPVVQKALLPTLLRKKKGPNRSTALVENEQFHTCTPLTLLLCLSSLHHFIVQSFSTKYHQCLSYYHWLSSTQCIPSQGHKKKPFQGCLQPSLAFLKIFLWEVFPFLSLVFQSIV